MFESRLSIFAHLKAKPKGEFPHTPKRSPVNSQSGKLYVTPKRKTSSELQESLSPKRLKQKGIEAAVDSQVHNNFTINSHLAVVW